jgi:hypothetical protein
MGKEMDGKYMMASRDFLAGSDSRFEDSNAGFRWRRFSFALFPALLAASTAEAYIDPGTTGLISQLLYMLFYGVLGVFLYFLRYIKQFILRMVQTVTGLLRTGTGGREPSGSTSDGEAAKRDHSKP